MSQSILYPQKQLVQRYRWNYGIAEDIPLTEEMVLAHWNLERQLTRELLDSEPAERWATFERAYTTLYANLGWLNQASGTAVAASPAERYRVWTRLVGSTPAAIYEVGSGKGEMIRHLSGLGHLCRGTEITRERGRTHVPDTPNLTWGVSDGVHLDQFEPAGSFDFVLSDNVIEHLHPDDAMPHFASARSLLREGGRYIVATPHIVFGPWDVSWVFNYEEAAGMHLREYDFSSLAGLARRAGFRSVRAVDQGEGVVGSAALLAYYRLIERLFALFPSGRRGRKLLPPASRLGFPQQVMLVAER